MRNYGLVMYKIEAHAADSSVWHCPKQVGKLECYKTAHVVNIVYGLEYFVELQL